MKKNRKFQMSLHRSLLGLIVSAMMGLAACSSSSSDSPAPEEAPPPAPPTPQEITPPNPLMAHQWCRAADWEDFQAILRMTVKEDKVQFEYLRIQDQKVYSHPYSQDYPWALKEEDQVIPRRYSLLLRKDPVTVSALYGFAEQKRIFDEILKMNPLLEQNQTEFAPATAITIFTRHPGSGDEIEKNLYPCPSFSNTLNELEGEVRPAFEISMLFGERQSTFTEKNKNNVAKAMPFRYPIEEKPVDLVSFQNTQWCSWREIGPQNLLLKTLTFGENRFLQNIHTQTFTTFPTEMEADLFLKENAKKSEAYEVLIDQGRIRGQNLTPLDKQKLPAQELFTWVNDADGKQALVRLDFRLPEEYKPVFTDIYFQCSDLRPLPFSLAFQMKLQQILDLQLQALQPALPVGE